LGLGRQVLELYGVEISTPYVLVEGRSIIVDVRIEKASPLLLQAIILLILAIIAMLVFRYAVYEVLPPEVWPPLIAGLMVLAGLYFLAKILEQGPRR